MKNKTTTNKTYSLMGLFFAFFIFLFLFPNLAQTTPLHESQDIYTFNTPEQRTEFDDLLKNLRCMVCQNQDLNDSHSPFSEHLREQIHDWVLEGKSQENIQTTLTERYGDFILFKPAIQKKTYVLWIAPFIIFITALVGLVILVQYRRRLSD